MTPLLLEVIVQSVADAVAAEQGGADRLEVVREIEREGMTPPLDLVRALTAETSLPLRVMVRESDGFGVHSPGELLAIQHSVADLADIGVHGIVVGFAGGGTLDRALMTSVLSVAPGLPVTLHRAFEAADDPMEAIDTALTFPQIDRILTSGGAGGWEARCQRLSAYASRAGARIRILAGGGVLEDSIPVLARCPGIQEIHVGRAARVALEAAGPVSVERVRRLKALIQGA